LHLTDRVKADAVDMSLLLRYYKRSAKHLHGIIYQSESWRGAWAELRIYHHLFGYNTIVVLMMIVFVSS